MIEGEPQINTGEATGISGGVPVPPPPDPGEEPVASDDPAHDYSESAGAHLSIPEEPDPFSNDQKARIKENIPEGDREKQSITEALNRFESIGKESLRKEMNDLFDAINERYSLDQQRPEDHKIVAWCKTNLPHLEKLVPFATGMATGIIAKSVARSFLSAAGVGGVAASVIIGGAWGGWRENKRSPQKYFSARAWIEHLNSEGSRSDQDKLEVIKQLLQNDEYKKHLKTNPEEAMLLLEESWKIAMRLEHSGLTESSEARKQHGIREIDEYLEKATKEKRKAILKAVGWGALYGAIGYGIGHLIGGAVQDVHDNQAMMEREVAQHVVPADHQNTFVGTAAQGTGEATPLQVPAQEHTYHMWHDGQNDAGHLAYDQSQQHFVESPDEFSTVQVETADGSTSHQVAGEISKALKDQIAHDMTPDQKVAFDDHIAKWINGNVDSGIIDEGATVRVPTEEINKALEAAHISIDPAAIEKLPEFSYVADHHTSIASDANSSGPPAQTAEGTQAGSPVDSLAADPSPPSTPAGSSPENKSGSFPWAKGAITALAIGAAAFAGKKFIPKIKDKLAELKEKKEQRAQEFQTLDILEKMQEQGKTAVYRHETTALDGTKKATEWEILGTNENKSLIYMIEVGGESTLILSQDEASLDKRNIYYKKIDSFTPRGIQESTDYIKDTFLAKKAEEKTAVFDSGGPGPVEWQIVGPSQNPVLPLLIKKIGQADEQAIPWRLTQKQIDSIEYRNTPLSGVALPQAEEFDADAVKVPPMPTAKPNIPPPPEPKPAAVPPPPALPQDPPATEATADPPAGTDPATLPSVSREIPAPQPAPERLREGEEIALDSIGRELNEVFERLNALEGSIQRSIDRSRRFRFTTLKGDCNEWNYRINELRRDTELDSDERGEEEQKIAQDGRKIIERINDFLRRLEQDEQ